MNRYLKLWRLRLVILSPVIAGLQSKFRRLLKTETSKNHWKTRGKPQRCAVLLCQPEFTASVLPQSRCLPVGSTEAGTVVCDVRRVILIIWCSWVPRGMWKLSSCDLTSARLLFATLKEMYVHFNETICNIYKTHFMCFYHYLKYT